MGKRKVILEPVEKVAKAEQKKLAKKARVKKDRAKKAGGLDMSRADKFLIDPDDVIVS